MDHKKFHEILHDLKSPLMSIEGYANLMLEDAKLSEKEKQQYLERILANVKTMQEMLVKLQESGD